MDDKAEIERLRIENAHLRSQLYDEDAYDAEQRELAELRRSHPGVAQDLHTALVDVHCTLDALRSEVEEKLRSVAERVRGTCCAEECDWWIVDNNPESPDGKWRITSHDGDVAVTDKLERATQIIAEHNAQRQRPVHAPIGCAVCGATMLAGEKLIRTPQGMAHAEHRVPVGTVTREVATAVRVQDDEEPST